MSVTPTANPAATSPVARLATWLGEHSIMLPAGIVLISAIVFSITVPHFSDLRNVLNLFEQLGVLGFLAIGMTVVMIAGGIDLSCYTVVSAAAVVGATAMIDTESAVLGGVLMLLIGLAFGAVNGAAIAYGRMLPFIVTLSTMVLAQGFAIWYTQAQSVYGLPDAYIDFISGRLFGVLPMPAVIILLVALIVGVVLARTRFGRVVYLTGANEHTARISGINSRRVKFTTYVVSGLMAGITALILTAIVGASTTSMVRDERLMDVIAATVIGGASLKGGSGSIVGTLLGLLFLTMLSNVFNLTGVSPFIAMVIKGLVLVAVIGLDVLRSKST